ncbi:Short chain dehydrogenase citE like protein [Verticillium longisporum]|uniref:Short chain dehydrogenase citE like protein n=1 Tax=Verticillium longisporum TaxID=100787 RepID=A0A8I2ZG72_VERLO|nr:Short chain dehydrogenase citE like protein [Verticillium longisporum]
MASPNPTKIYRTTTYKAISPLRPEFSTSGKNALITGAASPGIGSAIAKSLAQSNLANLALLGRTLKTLEITKASIEALKTDTKIHIYVVDVADASAVDAALKAYTEAIEGKIDILIANAGYMPDLTTIAEATPTDWWRAFEVAIKGNFNLLRAFLPVAASGAAVIHVSTAAVYLPYMETFSAYRASKMGGTKLFEYFHHENPNLFVLQIHPGLIGGTAMAAKFEHKAVDLGLVFDDISLPADFVVWATSDEAKFLDGKFVCVNWDVDELKAMRSKIEAADKTLPVMGLLGWD